MSLTNRGRLAQMAKLAHALRESEMQLPFGRLDRMDQAALEAEQPAPDRWQRPNWKASLAGCRYLRPERPQPIDRRRLNLTNQAFLAEKLMRVGQGRQEHPGGPNSAANQGHPLLLAWLRVEKARPVAARAC